ncbi:MAG: AAA family ATPase [Caldilineaceae bacterium]|nr:AAA family ATPase [Caldilineaceae bacterium]
MRSEDWQRVYWLCGSPCAGKSTLAQKLAERFNWQLYASDDWFNDHRERSTAAAQPTFYRISRLRGDALWLRPVVEQIATEIDFIAEQFTLVLEDLGRLLQESSQTILFEGAAVLPHQLHGLLPEPRHAFWLIPTEAFQRHYYAQRPWIHDVLATTSAPEQAFAHWMARDAGFAHWLEGQLLAHPMAWLSVDGALSLDETAALVAAHFSATPEPAPPS